MAGRGVGADAEDGGDHVPGGARGAVCGDGCGQDGAGLAEQGQGCGGVAGNGAFDPAGLLGRAGEVFFPQAEDELAGGVGQALDSLAKVSSPVTGAALALVLLVDPPNDVVGVPDEAGKRGEQWGVTGECHSPRLHLGRLSLADHCEARVSDKLRDYRVRGHASVACGDRRPEAIVLREPLAVPMVACSMA